MKLINRIKVVLVEKRRIFLSWRISPKTISAEAKAFADLSLDDTHRFLIESLDKNLLYIPLTEIDNQEFVISNYDKSLNSQFYGK